MTERRIVLDDCDANADWIKFKSNGEESTEFEEWFGFPAQQVGRPARYAGLRKAPRDGE